MQTAIVLPGDFKAEELSRAVENATQAAILKIVEPYKAEINLFGTQTFKWPRKKEGQLWKVAAELGKRYGVSRALYVAEHHEDPKRGLHMHMLLGFKDPKEMPGYISAMEYYGKSQLVPVTRWGDVASYITKHVGKGECFLKHFPRYETWVGSKTDIIQ